MQAAQIISSDLCYACKKIFGHDVDVSYDFLKYLQPAGVKTAFRKKAFQTHPDRAVILDSAADVLNAEFTDVRLAYDTLLFFLKTKNDFQLSSNPSDYKKTQEPFANRKAYDKSKDKKTRPTEKSKGIPDHFYNGKLPQGNLKFGQFLYYSGLISWRTLIEAICWQRRCRPLIGQIAVAWDLMSDRDVMQILDMRNFDEKFGEYARRAGYISSFHQLALVGKQRQLQRPFGEFFVETGILLPADIIKIAKNQQLHNGTFSS